MKNEFSKVKDTMIGDGGSAGEQQWGGILPEDGPGGGGSGITREGYRDISLS